MPPKPTKSRGSSSRERVELEKEIDIDSYSNSGDSDCETGLNEEEFCGNSGKGASSSQSILTYRIKLPALFFEFIHDQKGGRGFKVKC